MRRTALSAKQLELYRAIRLRGGPQLVVGDGVVRSGKSKTAIYALAGYVQENFAGHSVALAFRSVKQYEKIGQSELLAYCRETNTRWRKTSGGIEVFRPDGKTNEFLRVLGKDVSSVDTVQGLTLCAAFVDEAPLQPEDFVQELSFRCSVPGSKLVMVCNPAGGKRHWFYTTYIAPTLTGASPGAYTRFTVDDEPNPALPPGYYADLRLRYPSGHIMRRKLDAEWVEASGTIWNLDGRVRKPPTGAPSAIEISTDVASSSGTHALLIGKYASGYWVIDEWRHDGDDGNAIGHAQQVAEIIAKFKPYGRVNKWVVDPSAADFKVQVAHAKRVGATTARLYSGNNQVVFGIQNVAFYLAQGKLNVAPRCVHLLREIDSYVWDEGPAGRNEDKPVKRNDHGPDALRYWVMLNEDHKTPTRPYKPR